MKKLTTLFAAAMVAFSVLAVQAQDLPYEQDDGGIGGGSGGGTTEPTDQLNEKDAGRPHATGRIDLMEQDNGNRFEQAVERLLDIVFGAHQGSLK